MTPTCNKTTDFLLERFRAHGGQPLSIRVAFVWGDTAEERCEITISRGVARLSQVSNPDLKLFFTSHEHMRKLLMGQRDPFDLFMRGEFRSDGGLPLVFPVLSAFSAFE